jgi:hypothetical protein
VTSVRSECFRFNVCFRRLLADSEFADHVAIAVRVVRFQVIQQAAALAYQHQQSTPGCMILLVGFEMLGKVVDPFAKNRDLDLRRSGVRFMGPEAFDQVCLFFNRQHGVGNSSFSVVSTLQCLLKD